MAWKFGLKWGLPRPVSWRRAAYGVAEALFSEDGLHPPEAARLKWLMEDLEDFLAQVGGREQRMIQAGFLLMEQASPFLGGPWRPLSRVRLSERVRLLEGAQEGPLALALFGLKTALCFIWYEQPDRAREIGLTSPYRTLGGAARLDISTRQGGAR